MSTLKEKTDELFAKWNRSDSPGCAVGIFQDGTIRYKNGFGMADLEHDIPISPSTVFDIGSVSKQFTAMCCLLLEEQGQLTLEDNIQKYLPQMPDYGHAITIDHLIHHKSGISCCIDVMELSGKALINFFTEAEVFEIICLFNTLNFVPGTQRSYSNSNYFLLAKIIECVAGKSLCDYAEEHIFAPLGMKNTFYHDQHNRLIKNRAWGYKPNEKGEFIGAQSHLTVAGPGGIHSTIEDLFLWDQNFYANRLGRSGQDLITKMLTVKPEDQDDYCPYTFGNYHYLYQGLKKIAHDGSWAGQLAELVRFPEAKFSVVLLTNNFSEFLDWNTKLIHEIADLYISDFYLEEKAQPEKNPPQPEITIDPSIYDDLVGRYSLSFDSGYTQTFTREGNRLLVESTNRPPYELFPSSETTFFPKVFEADFCFQRDEAGKPTQFTIYKDGQELPFLKMEQGLLSLEQLKEYEGDYECDELHTTYRIGIQNNRLYLKVVGAQWDCQWPLYFNQNEHFILRRDDFTQVTFERDESDKIVSFTLASYGIQNLRFLRINGSSPGTIG